MSGYLPKRVEFLANEVFFAGKALAFTLKSGLCVFVGPNGSGKTEVLKWLRGKIRSEPPLSSDRKLVYLTTGRNAVFENYRSFGAQANPAYLNTSPAAVGHQDWQQDWWQYETSTGMMVRLKNRPDLLLKVEARLQSLFQKRLQLTWGQSGLQVGFAPTTGGKRYFANAEASGLLQLIPLLAAIYDDEVGILMVDEPEISLHPQLQVFLLQEMANFAGDPEQADKKLLIIATHSPTMLPVRRIRDLCHLFFFTDRRTPPIQIPETAGELRSSKLSALIARLSENHKLAFFSRSVLLVEGPSDEIIVSGLSLRVDHPLLGSNTQVVPITGKGQFGEAVKFFRMIGKKVYVLADLDALTDDNQLVNVFSDIAQPFAHKLGMGSVGDIDRSIRDKLNALLDDTFEALSPRSETHRYWTGREEGPDNEQKAKRRATVAALLSGPDSELQEILGGALVELRTRFDALLKLLAQAGCVVLRKGTIEDYYFANYPGMGKPEAAASEAEGMGQQEENALRDRYKDVFLAIETAAPLRKIDENALLREQLGSLLGAAMQIVQPGMSDDELNARAAANLGTDGLVFRFKNRSANENSRTERRVEVHVTSSLFKRDSFPFEVGERDNITAIVEQKLPIAR